MLQVGAVLRTNKIIMPLIQGNFPHIPVFPPGKQFVLGIVPFVATLLKGRFVVILIKWLLVRLGYIGLGDCPAGLVN